MIRPMISLDGKQVLEIYKEGLDTRMATFETEVPYWKDWNTKHHQHSRFVYEEKGKVLGWVALSPTSVRRVYSGVAEVSIYITADAWGKGIGSKLMQEVVRSSEQNGIWTLTSSVFPENKATLRLHAKFGFRVLGRREKIARLDGLWKDTVVLERRSEVEGM